MKNKDNLNGIFAFITTAQLGSFTAAAERLGLTKSAVAKSVSRLEERLGLKLFHRSTRRLSLTPDGELYLASCRKAVDILEHAESILSTHIEKPSGRLRVDLPAAFGRKLVLPLLLEISELNPELSLAISFNERYVDLIDEGIDFVVRIGELRDSSGLIARQLTTQKLALCASPKYVEKHGQPETVEDIDRHRCIVGFRTEQAIVWCLKEQDGSIRRFIPPVGHEYGDGDAMLCATLNGQGLCQLPRWLIQEHLNSGQLVEVLSQYSGCEVPIHILWPKSSHLMPKIRHTVDVLLKEAKKGTFG